jgi:6-phosphogluconolactonase
MTEQILIFPDYSELASAVAMEITKVIKESIRARGKCVLSLCGGETPRGIYHNLSSKPLVDWSRVHLFLGDERMTPANGSQSNFSMIENELLSKIIIPAKNVYRIAIELGPEGAAIAYEKEIRFEMGNGIPKFDLILLGIGKEGHTASLFPGTAALFEEERAVVANFIPPLNSWRVTLTLPSINNARKIFFLASGQAKAKIVKKIVNAGLSEIDLPATLVAPRDGVVTWMLDLDAAANLDITSGGGPEYNY